MKLFLCVPRANSACWPSSPPFLSNTRIFSCSFENLSRRSKSWIESWHFPLLIWCWLDDHILKSFSRRSWTQINCSLLYFSPKQIWEVREWSCIFLLVIEPISSFRTCWKLWIFCWVTSFNLVQLKRAKNLLLLN